MEMIQWFFVILAADLFAAFLKDVSWKKLIKKKRKPRQRKTAQVIPFKKAD